MEKTNFKTIFKEVKVLKLGRELNISGTLVDKHQLEQHLEKIASNHILSKHSDKSTYPIPLLKNNFQFITKTYEILNEHIKLGITIHPAGEWLLDNYYIIEETVKNIAKELTLKKYTNLIGLENDTYQGFARAYVLACEIIAYTDNKIEEDVLKDYLIAYQNKKTLSMEEIWNIKSFLQIAMIQNIKQICERIYFNQVQKYKVEGIVERLVEKKSSKDQIFKNVPYLSEKNYFNEMKYPFIEYMSYKLKKYGKQAYGYLQILEEEVEKAGTLLSEVIKKEHFEIAIQKVSMENAIKSLKNILRMDFLESFEKINGVEELLRQDPANVYDRMDYKTKIAYRNSIQEISKNTKVAETYIVKKALELSKREENKEEREKHIGYYLVAEGMQRLYQVLGSKRKIISHSQKSKRYIIAIISSSAILTLFFMSGLAKSLPFGKWNLWIEPLLGILFYIPISEIVTKITQYIMMKIRKPKLIPKLDFSKGIPKEHATMVIVPTIIKNKAKVEEIMKKLEIYYLANKSENLYFALLGDCSSGAKEKESFDAEVIETGKKEVEKLNQKYTKEEPIFHFFYRNRKWNEKEKMYLGWERKRGLIHQLNHFLLTGEPQDFCCISMEKIPEITYVITLDADTELVLNTGLELVGAMAHILNKPILNKNRTKVIQGHGIMQPRVGVNLKASQKNLFTKIFAGLGGTDLYANAISDVYQDNFGEGIFAGKGIYNLKTFDMLLKDAIPENTVLSHDLLEGNYLRCGLVSDITLMDGWPTKYISSAARNHRWIRGDWQIIRWLDISVKNKEGKIVENPFDDLEKFKILDNLRRSLLEPTIFLGILLLVVLNCFVRFPIWQGITIAIISQTIPAIIDILNYIIYKKDLGNEYMIAQKNFTKVVAGIYGSILRVVLEFSFLPYKAYLSLNAICKTIHRMVKTKQNMLEWVTAEEAEKQAKTDLLSYYRNMIINLLVGTIFIFISIETNQILLFFIGVLWLLGPYLAWYISKEVKEKRKLEELNKQEREYLLEIAKRTWTFFKDNMNEENHYLPPDNYQEDRKEKIAHRTSPTNIGLGILAIVSAYDLEFENLEKTLNHLEKVLETIQEIPKWNGHLYNWYDTKTLIPLHPRYVSTVDSGNFIGYLYVLKSFLCLIGDTSEWDKIVSSETLLNSEEIMVNQIEKMKKTIDDIISHTDFSVLYDEKSRLFSIGFHVEENKLTDSYYDLLASEARQTSLVAIAKKDVPSKHWNQLSRTLTCLNHYKGLISWSGTAFEYLMSNINVPKYPGSLLEESCKFAIMSQKEYSKKLDIPWGITEAAFYLKDLNGNYQYKAFGIPWLGLKRGLADEMVVAPYGSFLAITDEPKSVLQNLRILEKQGMYDKYGFYESVDYTPTRLKYGKRYEAVKTYMAHHQGLILLSINNLFHENILQKRFFYNPEIAAIDILLQERMPQKTIITKEKKEKVEKLKYQDYENYQERVITKFNDNLKTGNIISNEDYTIVMDENGNGYSKYKNIQINRFKRTADTEQGIFFYLKNIKTKRLWTNTKMRFLSKPDKYKIVFAPDTDKIVRTDGNIETTTKITIAANEPLEIRKLEIKNTGLNEEILEVSSVLEPIISTKEQDYSHMAFNNLFLKFDVIDNIILVKRKARQQGEKDQYLAVTLFTEEDTIGDMEFELDKERLVGRGNLNIPNMIKESKPFSKSIGLFTEAIVALKRTIKVKPEEKTEMDLLISIGEEKEEVIERIQRYQNKEKIAREFEIVKARIEAETRYLEIKGSELETYQKLLSYMFLGNPLRKMELKKLPKRDYSQKELWKYGISGDIPILYVKIKDVNDVYVIEEVLKAYEFARLKNLELDLVILNEEENVYEQYVKEQIENLILNRHISYLKNIPGGIFVLNGNEMSKEDKDLFSLRSNMVITSEKGDLKTMIEDLEEDYIEQIKNIGMDKNKREVYSEEKDNYKKPEFKDLQYFNEYGGFTEDGKEYLIKINQENKTPTVWSNIMANENFGTLVTENMGGFTWSKNSRLNRLTSWNNMPSLDIPSEIIYLQNRETGETWSLGNNPMPDKNDYYITYGFGYSKYSHSSNGILQDATVFVPREDKAKVTLLNLKNIDSTKKEIKIIYYLKPVLGEDEIKTNSFLELKKQGNVILTKNLYATEFSHGICYLSGSEEIVSYTGDKDFFIGKGNLANPECLQKVELNKESGLGENSCIAVEFKITLQEFENKEIALVFGEEENEIDAKNLAYKYSKISNCMEELKRIKEYWKEKLEMIQVKTPVESLNILLNGWTLYQTIACRLWGRSGYYQSGGAIGFRDQLQDTLGLKYCDINWMKKQILKAASHQFIEGDVEHWWHEETGRGIRTRFSDDLLWLVYVTCEYIETTNDDSILDSMIPYIQGEQLKEGQDESYDFHPKSEVEETLYEHCKKAIKKALNFGKDGLPKIGSGDWNDGFSAVGNKGRGTSIWLGFFLYDILEKFKKICEQRDEPKLLEEYEKVQANLKKALNTIGWDGRWYKRAITDDGDALGSIENDECRIDSISQSWACISGAGDNDKKYISMNSLETHLVDKENGIIKLLDPPFDKGKFKPGYIKAYLPGVRENGGQYTHAAIWAVMAEALLGFGNKAVEYYRMINPIEHSKTKEESQKYKVEPYAIPGDVYGANNLAGRGGWTWYTGSSSWYYKVGIENILGLQIKKGKLIIEPCIPDDWKEYEIRYHFKSSIYHIKVKNPDRKNTGVTQILCNGEECKEKEIPLIDDGKIKEIEAIM